jgi:RNA exonuclease 1
MSFRATDFPFSWSGITEEALAPINTTLAEVQDRLLKLLSPPSAPTPILLGHSLESDLKALKLCHPFCIDTAIVYHHPRGRPLKPGLAWLTKKWCGREIQTRGEGGHDPEEDARACLDLLKKKIENGKYFYCGCLHPADQFGAGPGFGEFKIDYESIFERMSRAVGRGGPGTIRSAVVDHGNPAVMHGAKANTSVPCTSDAEVLEGLLQVIPAHEFSFGRFTALADAMGCKYCYCVSLTSS